jgi:fatty acid CoA ligase FadD9
VVEPGARSARPGTLDGEQHIARGGTDTDPTPEGTHVHLDSWPNPTGSRPERFARLLDTDEQFRAARPSASTGAVIRRPGTSLSTIMNAVMDGYAERPALGTRAVELARDPATGRATRRLLPRFDTMTYGELWRRAGALAAAWWHGDPVPVRTGDFVATLGFTSGEYAAIELACARLGAVCLPLQAAASAEQLRPIAEETAPRLLACSVRHLDTAVSLVLGSGSLRRLVVFDFHPEVDDEREQVETARVRLAEAGAAVVLETFTDVLARGRTLPVPSLDEEPHEDRLALVVYTSGSTGTPKGAMFTEHMVAAMWRGYFPDHREMPLFGMAFAPMSYAGGRAALFGILGQGGTAYFIAKDDLSTLLDDITLARPTELLLAPRICDMLHQRYESELRARVAQGAEHAEAAAAAKAELREEVLGGRVLWAMFGGAPLAADRWAFVESVLGCPLHEGYGSTEMGGFALLDRKVLRKQITGYKLVDVPELGYFSTDVPHPRGQLLVKSTTLFPGYFKRPDVTAEVLDEDGFYRTGDIMAQIGPDQLTWVDRTNNVLKLSQGEFVAVSRLEELFSAGPAVRQIYLYGNSERAYLLAVVVPAPETVTRAGGDPRRVKALVLEALQRTARDVNLQSFEIPRNLVLEFEPFTIANGLLSSLQKPLRAQLKERYGARLEQLYADLADRESSELPRLRAAGRDRPVFETVAEAARTVLGSAFDELTAEMRFTDLGGDSLSALSLSALLQEIFDIEVPVGAVISPANDLRALAEYIGKQLAPGTKQLTASALHGDEATEVRAADLTLGKFIDEETLRTAATLARPGGDARTVLLTGATGYLGRFLCLEWLSRLAEVDGKLLCIVRGSDVPTARARLDAVFDSGDADLLRKYRELAAGRIEVLAGDIGEADLGLSPETWQRLAETVDLIVHPAAQVNHLFPYHQLFGPNVAGTADLIRLAITAKLKPFSYVSTAGVLFGQAEDAPETADIREISPVRRLDTSYANGYGVSKWAGEVLLREAHELCGLPVATFRSNMILAHSAYTGQLNVPDLLTRLLLSLITTGIAPGSFYGPGGPAHYDGLPVDFIAGAVTALAAGSSTGHEVYNIRNPHEDGVSLDTFVDWLSEAGYPITRIDDHAEWFARFQTAVRSLPEREKRQSLLPLLPAHAQPTDPALGAGIPAEHFRDAVRRTAVGTGGDIPHITAALIRKYATDLEHLGLVRPGSRVTAPGRVKRDPAGGRGRS